MPKPPEDLTLHNREIVPISDDRFGVVVTEAEAMTFMNAGYNVRATPQMRDEEIQYYLVVHVGSYLRQGSFELAMLETVGYADVVILPYHWIVGKRSGIKACVKSAEPRPR